MRILLPGVPTVEADAQADGSRAFFEGIAKVRVKETRDVKGPSRAGAPQAEVMVEAAPDDVVELDFGDGIRQWVSVAQLEQDMERSGHRSTQLGGVVVPFQPLGMPLGAESRGGPEWVLKGLKLFGFDPVEEAANFAERKIVEKFEEKLNPQPGLYPLTGPTALGKAITSDTQFDASGPALIFIHGTASSIAGSFGEMTAAWEKLTARYGRRIYGFQHKTLSVSPVANALALAELIPDGATLHLVSHSRGGLVGELLCIRKITDVHLEAFRQKAVQRDEDVEPGEKKDREKARAAEIAALEALSQRLAKFQYNIERFVRVACPARGTILASGRLDLYLSLITSAIGMAVKSTPYLEPIHEFLKAVTIEVARRRTRPEGLPGFEAQMPESPLIHLLNNTGLESQADLAVIAGDVEMGGGFWKSLGVLATNLFYLQRHDLVVNTEAMYAGMARTGGTWFFFDQDSGVSHFNYFKNPKTRDRLVSWLEQPAGQNIDAEFKRRTREAIGATSRSAGGRDTAGLSALFIVPGIMGTLLKDGSGLLWLDQQRLSADGMKPLEIGAAGVQTAGIVQIAYQKMEEHFAATYNVVLFGYDWRRSVADAAELLAAQVKERDDRNEVVRIVAHSMGGLVARAMIALHPKLWESVCAKGGRLIQLGTPNRGSFAIPRILWGVEPTVQMLAMLDPRQTKKKVCEILAAYPGIADMLPETDDGRFFDEAWWKKDQGQLASPASEELRRAQALRAKISAGDKRGIVYVAGAGDATPSDLIVEAEGAVWQTTEEGDGTVPYALGRIAGVAPYFVDAVHGELANEPAVFEGYAELLATGQTSKLSNAVPARTRAVGASGVLRGAEPVLFPTEEELLAAALGKKRSRPTQQRVLPALNIAVRHGDLRRSRLPLVIGHYLGDKIVHAERTLDEQLEGRLSRRAALGLYPGAEGTVELVLASNCHPPGALVVGLGQIGEISMEKVRRAVMEAALRYAVHLVEKPAEPEPAKTLPSTGLSTLLLGTAGGRPLRIVDSVNAIVSGILDANKALEAEKLIDKVCFDTLHIVELFETVAAQALYGARQLAQRLRREKRVGQEVVVAPYVQTIGRGRVQPPLNPYETGWWPRIEITQERNAEGEPTGNFRFSIPTSRAGLEEQITSSQRGLIDELVEQAIVSPEHDESASSDLFQLLVPNSLKPRLDLDADNAVVVVDKTTAPIPWEMLGRRKINSDKMEFLGLQMGLLRQFKTTAMQPRQPDSRSFRAVIIGDAEQPFAPLPGAVAEARAIGALLDRHQYEAPVLTKKNFLTNLRAVLTTDYRILHIAAHGFFDPDPNVPSGVVLGQDKLGKPKFLTSREIRQMPAMPELVFLNCCYLGETGPAVPPAPAQWLQSVNALAASLAEELINKGVKVVIAAGWAVHDGAAKAFAEAFYSWMLEGQCFGDAVRHARKVAASDFPSVNTWAAYQCYGSPDYRLEGAGAAADAGKSQDGTKYVFVTRTEFLHAIRDLHSFATDGRIRTDKSGVRADLELLARSLPALWLDGEMLYELGMVWGDLGDFPKAVELLNRALLTEEGSAPFRAAEQLANFEDRQAAAEAKTAGANEAVRERWARAQQHLERLLQIGQTRERLSLLGACKKRRAGFAKGKEAAKLRAESVAHYQEGYELSVAANDPDPYPGINWLTHLFFSPQGKSSRKTLATELERLLAAIDARVETETEKEIWRHVQRADALLLHHLVKADLHQPGTNGAQAPVERIKSAYADAFHAGATQREMSSVAGQVAFIRNSLGANGAASPSQPAVLKALDAIHASISSPA